MKKSESLNWTFVSPSAHIALGRRTGEYRTGEDHLLINSRNESYVSYEDYAAAIVDEIENPRYLMKRFTVVSAL